MIMMKDFVGDVLTEITQENELLTETKRKSARLAKNKTQTKIPNKDIGDSSYTAR